MISSVKDVLGNAFGLFTVSRKRDEYRYKLKSAVDAILLYVSDSVYEYTLLEELHNAIEKFEDGMSDFTNGSKKGVKKAKMFAVAWILSLCATLWDKRFGIFFDII